jgi:CDGSH-type Zn-finger protein
MITNIIVLASIIFIAIFVAAYKSKRPEPPVKCGCGKSETGLCDNSHAENNATGSIETVTNDTSSNTPTSS